MEDKLVTPETDEKIAACLERVADEHSGCFSEEDALIVECAIASLSTRTTVTNEEVVSVLERLLDSDGSRGVYDASKFVAAKQDAENLLNRLQPPPQSDLHSSGEGL